MDKDERKAFILGVISGVTGNAVYGLVCLLLGSAVLGGIAAWVRALTDFERGIYFSLSAAGLLWAALKAYFLFHRARIAQQALRHASPSISLPSPAERSTLGSSPPPMVLIAENGPGRALVRVDNLGERATFTATATVAHVSETVPNIKFLQTYGLRWRSNGKDELTLERGAAGALLIASSGESSRGKQRDLHELLLEGYEEGKPVPVDRFRWHNGDPPGAVTIDLDIAVSTSQSVVTQRFRVTSREWGGVLIEEMPNTTNTGSSLPSSSVIAMKCVASPHNLPLPYGKYNQGEVIRVSPKEAAGYLSTGVFAKIDREMAGSDLIMANSEVIRIFSNFKAVKPDYGDYHPHGENYQEQWATALENMVRAIALAEEFDPGADYPGLRAIYSVLYRETQGAGRLSIYQESISALSLWLSKRLGRPNRGLPPITDRS
jgi:hypothetical protein